MRAKTGKPVCVLFVYMYIYNCIACVCETVRDKRGRTWVVCVVYAAVAGLQKGKERFPLGRTEKNFLEYSLATS